jgi:adenosylhomocysteine nucleosidase
MRVLVTFAVEAEFAPWRKKGNLNARTANGFEVHEGKVARATVDFVVTGMGMANARRGTQAAWNTEHKLCIGAGFAGALKPALKIGDVLAARAVQQLGKKVTLECSRNLVAVALENRALEAKLFLTADRVVATAEEKKRYSSLADAVDMEGFATLSVAKEKNVPAIVVRAISDRLDEDVPSNVDTTLDERGRVKMGRVVKHLAAHPLQIPALIGLGKKSRIAAEALEHFLQSFINELSFKTQGWLPPDFHEVAAP